MPLASPLMRLLLKSLTKPVNAQKAPTSNDILLADSPWNFRLTASSVDDSVMREIAYGNLTIRSLVTPRIRITTPARMNSVGAGFKPALTFEQAMQRSIFMSQQRDYMHSS